MRPKRLDFDTLLKNPQESFLPFLQLVLIYRGCDMSSELFKYIGRDKLREFLIEFGGRTITFPSWESMGAGVKDAYILWRASQIDMGTYTMRQLSEDTCMSDTVLGTKIEFLRKITNGGD